MHRIFKYKIDRQNIHMPAGAEILCCKMKDNALHIWALVDEEQPVEVRKFVTLPTGVAIIGNDVDNLLYIDTVIDGPYVWHLFEVESFDLDKAYGGTD